MIVLVLSIVIFVLLAALLYNSYLNPFSNSFSFYIFIACDLLVDWKRTIKTFKVEILTCTTVILLIASLYLSCRLFLQVVMEQCDIDSTKQSIAEIGLAPGLGLGDISSNLITLTAALPKWFKGAVCGAAISWIQIPYVAPIIRKYIS